MTMKYLPALNQDLQPPSPAAGSEWGEHGAGISVLKKYSDALEVQHADVRAERLKSIPTPWARLLLFEQALFSPRHPAHSQITGEWRGLLGAIGLAPYLKLQIDTVPLSLAGEDGIIRDLQTMIPRGDPSGAWDSLALLRVEGELVGATSPRTLVFTGIRGVKMGRIPFQERQRLIDPVEYYRRNADTESLGLILEWLDRTIQDFGNQQTLINRLLGTLPGAPGAAPVPRLEPLMRNLEEWRKEARAAANAIGVPNQAYVERFAPSNIGAAFPDGHPAQAVFGLLVQAIPSADLGKKNWLQTQSGRGVVDPGREGILVRGGHPYSGDVMLPNGMARAVRNGRFAISTGAADIGSTMPDLGPMFERKLIPVAELDASAVALQVGKSRYLLPLRRDVLDHVDFETLRKSVTATGDLASGVVVRLEIPLAGGLSLRHEKKYGPGEVLAQDQVLTPFLTVWPDFESEQWPYYYYVERHVQRATAQLHFSPANAAPADRRVSDAEPLRWGKLDGPPRVWVGTYKSDQGLLLTNPADKITPTADAWEVSIDFGSTHTRAFRAVTDAAGKPDIREIALRRRARFVLGQDPELQFSFFSGPQTPVGLDSEPPTLVWLPVAQAMSQSSDWLPSDGVMYWTSVQDAPDVGGLRGNLKWQGDDQKDRSAFHSYVTQLFLSIAAEAAHEGATIKSLITAFPSVLPGYLRHRHRTEWAELTRRFDVQLLPPRSESDAIASYFRGLGATVMTNLLAIDIGGSTSDLSVWSEGKRALGDSVRLAGDILSRLVNVDAEAREAFAKALGRPPFNVRSVKWANAEPSKNGFILNSILRSMSQQPHLMSEPGLLARNLYEGEGSPGEKIVAHLVYMVATVTFVLGMMVRRQKIDVDRFDIRFAGKGSEFLHWLDALASHSSVSLPERFFRAGLSARSDASTNVHLPGLEVKQEVGRGLLRAPVGESEGMDDRVTFLGETGFTGQERDLAWHAVLDLPSLRGVQRPARPIALERLEMLKAFVAAFSQDPAGSKAARALGITDASWNSTLRDSIHERLFGAESVWSKARTGNGQPANATLEPFFVTEAKVLLEHATGRHGLFL